MEERPNCKVCGNKLTKKNNGKSVTCSRECSVIHYNQKTKLERDRARDKLRELQFKTFIEKPEFDEIFFLQDVFPSKEETKLFKQSILKALKYRFKTQRTAIRHSLCSRQYNISVASINELIGLYNTYKRYYVKAPTIMKRDLIFKVQKIIGNAIKLQEQKDVNAN